MSILTKKEIIKEIEASNIQVDPYNPDKIGPGSIDLSLGNKFRVFKRANQVYDVNEDLDYKDLTTLEEKEEIIVQPGETILGITKEKITLPSNICGWLEGRSRFARLGLLVHISASFMQPGISNHQVLEISNMGQVPLRLHAGTKICQFIFQRTEGEARYEGRFTDQMEP